MIPKIGDLIYVPTEQHVTHGLDDIEGGLCEVCEVSCRGIESTDAETHWVMLKQFHSLKYAWETYLEPLQGELKRVHGDSRATRCPDYRPECNTRFLEGPLDGMVHHLLKEACSSEARDVLGGCLLAYYGMLAPLEREYRYALNEVPRIQISELSKEKIRTDCRSGLSSVLLEKDELANECAELYRVKGLIDVDALKHTRTLMSDLRKALSSHVYRIQTLVESIRRMATEKKSDTIGVLLCEAVGTPILEASVQCERDLAEIDGYVAGEIEKVGF